MPHVKTLSDSFWTRAEGHCISAMQIILVAEADSVSLLPLPVTSSQCRIPGLFNLSFLNRFIYPIGWHTVTSHYGAYKLVNVTLAYWTIPTTIKGLFDLLSWNSTVQSVNRQEMWGAYEYSSPSASCCSEPRGRRTGRMPKTENLVETLTFRECGTLSVAHSHISIDSAVLHLSPDFTVAIRFLLKQVSRNFALLPGHPVCTADDFALYSFSPCFLLFANNVLKYAKPESHSQHCLFWE